MEIPATSGRDAAPASSSALLIGLVVALFFLWGGITSLNDILIPKLKGLFQLSYAQAMLTQFAFFTAYAIVSLPAGAIVARLGYGRGIVLGLATIAAGCLLFIPAAASATFAMFLGALFVLAAGVTLLQVAANPLIANLGEARNAHSRLTFAQAFNSLGTTVAPLVGAQVILGSIAVTDPATLSGEALRLFQAREAAVIGHSYLALALVLTTIALIFWMWRNRLGGIGGAAPILAGFGLLRQRRLGLGVAAIFLYVGAEVTIGSLLANYLMQPTTLGLSQQSAGAHIAFYWGGAMVGRFVGGLVLRVVSPGKALAGAAIGAVALVALSALTTGEVAGWSLIAVGLANAIMFPTIFSLAIEGLDEHTPRGSGLLCMAIVGGAIVPLLAGATADHSSLATALAIPVGCYVFIALFGLSASRPVRINAA